MPKVQVLTDDNIVVKEWDMGDLEPYLNPKSLTISKNTHMQWLGEDIIEAVKDAEDIAPLHD